MRQRGDKHDEKMHSTKLDVSMLQEILETKILLLL